MDASLPEFRQAWSPIPGCSALSDIGPPTPTTVKICELDRAA